LARYGETHADTLALSISDDAFAPPEAARRLLSNYPNLRVVHETITPASLGCRRLGHFGFLRRPAGEFIWRRAADWLIATDGAVGLTGTVSAADAEKSVMSPPGN